MSSMLSYVTYAELFFQVFSWGHLVRQNYICSILCCLSIFMLNLTRRRRRNECDISMKRSQAQSPETTHHSSIPEYKLFMWWWSSPCMHLALPKSTLWWDKRYILHIYHKILHYRNANMIMLGSGGIVFLGRLMGSQLGRPLPRHPWSAWHFGKARISRGCFEQSQVWQKVWKYSPHIHTLI